MLGCLGDSQDRQTPTSTPTSLITHYVFNKAKQGDTDSRLHIPIKLENCIVLPTLAFAEQPDVLQPDRTLTCSALCALQVRYGDRFVEELHLPVEVVSFDADQPGQGPDGSQPPLATEEGGRLSRAAPLPWGPSAAASAEV